MAAEKKWVQVVSRLNRQTQEGSIGWSDMPVPESLKSATNEVISSFYGTRFHGRNLGIYEVRYQQYLSELDRLAWNGRITLAFFTDDWTYEVEFPAVSGISELMEAVRHQAAGVEQFLDEVLEEEEESEKS